MLNTVLASDVYTQYEIPKNVVVYSTASRSISSIDPIVDETNKKNYFPGNRKTNQLVIYTKNYGKRTNTNEFGAEAIVKGNTVVAISGADSLIPDDGIVISGHGSAKTWINKNMISKKASSLETKGGSCLSYTSELLLSLHFSNEKSGTEREEIRHFEPTIFSLCFNAKKYMKVGGSAG